jgi:NADH-quinone oxidoreductase subunit F
VNLGKDVDLSGTIAVIGGGSTAFDAARVAIRKGAKEVHIFYRRTMEDMPADKSEIKEAMEEGVIIHELVRPLEFLGDKKVKQIKFIKMELSGFDSDGRKNRWISRIRNSWLM